MMIIDNSEYMRNGDYQPTRFDAQADAVNTLFRTKIDSNPENTVGIMTMAGKGPEVLVTHTKELGQIIQAVHSVSDKIGGEADITTAIAVAQLALKHRQNKNLRQRIVVFVGSPLTGQAAEESSMVKLAKKLKKNSVAVDFVAFGDGIENGPLSVLRTFSETASSSDNSHYVAAPPGQVLLSEVLLSSAVLAADRGIPDDLAEATSGQGEGSGATQFEFGVDPSLDPELAMALRMSMEEEQARQAAVVQPAPAPEPVASTPKATVSALVPETLSADPADEEEDEMLREALALSNTSDVPMEEDAEDDDDEGEIQKAIAMGTQKEKKEDKS